MNDVKRKVARLFEKYYMDGWGMEIAASNYPITRIIPVEARISPEVEVMPFERASEIINNARTIALLNCVCRLTNNNCDNPLEVCLSFDASAEYAIRRIGQEK